MQAHALLYNDLQTALVLKMYGSKRTLRQQVPIPGIY